jgi:hypothetical protein
VRTRPATAGPASTGEAIALIEAAAGPHELFGADAARCYRRRRQLLGDLDDLLGRLYGPRRFRPFVIPA